MLQMQLQCKNKILLQYFGEIATENCGTCSVCESKKNTSLPKNATTIIIEELKKQPQTSRELLLNTNLNEEQLLHAIRELLDSNKLKIIANNKFTLQ